MVKPLSPEAKRAQEVAAVILSQLGGARLRAMINAQCMSGNDAKGRPFLLVRHMRGKNKINATRITLDHDDTYSVEFLIVTRTAKVHETVTEVYAEDLVGIFEHRTGLALSLLSRVSMEAKKGTA
jgi:hypothetical protein